MPYELFYWSGIPGRGEFVRLALEDAGVAYVDIALQDDGNAKVSQFANDKGIVTPPFAPPFLRDGAVVVGQTAAILQYLAPKLKLVSTDAAQAVWTHQIQLTIADLVDEAHDVHHPIGSHKYYEEQIKESRKRAKGFRDLRIPKYLTWFETILARNPAASGTLVGDGVSYVDLSLFHVVQGLTYAFPNTMKREIKNYKNVRRHSRLIGARPRLKAYLKSERRTPFNEAGIFRHYPALDRKKS